MIKETRRNCNLKFKVFYLYMSLTTTALRSEILERFCHDKSWKLIGAR